MKLSLQPSPVLALALASAVGAQHPAGLLTGMPPAGVILSSVGTSVGSEVMFRISGDAYRGLGEYVPPAAHRVRGAVVRLRDNTVADGETFDMHVYLENAQTNLPTITGPSAPGTTAVTSVLGLTTAQGITEHEVSVIFPQPVDVPFGSDLFVSVVYHTPGLVIRAVGGTSVPGISTSALDACGAGLAPNEAFMLLHEIGTIQPLGSGLVGWQPMIELLVDGSSGVAVSARSSQMAATASMYSGLHPDSATPPNQTARHDIPGYLFRGNGTMPAGSPVFLLGSTAPFASGPWIVLSPGNAILHLSPAGLVALTMATTDAAGNALLMWPVPNSPAVRGLDVRTQAFGFDVAGGVVRGGAGVRQRF